jgi:quercetin dioxygenase-like cupin family protein
VDVRPLGAALATTPTRTLVKTEALTVVRMVVPAGKEIPTHTAKGELIVQCLEGKIAFTTDEKTHELEGDTSSTSRPANRTRCGGSRTGRSW